MEQGSARRVAWLGVVMLVVVVYITYHPGFAMGFYLDDYLYLERAGRTEWANALAEFFDPSRQIVWYRPAQAIQFFLEYHLLGGNADSYHFLNIAFHALNVLLLYMIVWRVSRNWHIGLTSALFYATFSVFPSAINWVGIVDPLASVFYLACLWFWLAYLERGAWRYYALAFAAFVCALFSKQTSLTIPIVLFLIEWLSKKTFSIDRTVRRYALFGVSALAFALLHYITPSTHIMTGVFGWQIDTQMAWNLVQYLVLFFFPYSEQPSVDVNQLAVGTPFTYAWMVLAVALLVRFTWKTHNRALVCLIVFAMLNLLPVLPFPFIEHRYLYLPMMSASVMLALLLYQVFTRYRSTKIFTCSAALTFALIAFDNGLSINTSALTAAELTTRLRVPFQIIESQHPAFPKNTLLYFIDPITPTKGGIGGMAMLRYGPAVWVKDWSERAEFDRYATVHVYYHDETGRLREVDGEKNIAARLSNTLPVDFEGGIRLDAYEVPRTTLSRGMPVILLLYWHATRRIERDYIMFARLVAPNGKVMATCENPPRQGRMPTSSWELHRFTPDAILLPVNEQIPVGNTYRVEIGWLDAVTRQPLLIVNAPSQSPDGRLVLEPFMIEP